MTSAMLIIAYRLNGEPQRTMFLVDDMSFSKLIDALCWTLEAVNQSLNNFRIRWEPKGTEIAITTGRSHGMWIASEVEWQMALRLGMAQHHTVFEFWLVDRYRATSGAITATPVASNYKASPTTEDLLGHNLVEASYHPGVKDSGTESSGVEHPAMENVTIAIDINDSPMRDEDWSSMTLDTMDAEASLNLFVHNVATLWLILKVMQSFRAGGTVEFHERPALGIIDHTMIQRW
ncbi:hypothetical protein MMC13_001375 [Lambiella insularis]|nr:hypothetical protein [Lambiella insularis]